MKIKLPFKLICFLVILSLFSTLASAAIPAGESVQPRYISVTQLGSGLEINRAGRADCYSSVALGNLTDEAVLIMSLRRSEDGVSWSSEETWSASGTAGTFLEESIYVASGYYYKLNISVTVYNEAGHYIETVTDSSNIVNYGAD